MCRYTSLYVGPVVVKIVVGSIPIQLPSAPPSVSLGDRVIDAESRAYFEAASLLSHLAFTLDIPLHIAHTHLKETKSKHVRIGFVRQFGYQGMGNLSERESLGNDLMMEMKGSTYAALTSIYREALNSESPFYQFLCFCRVIQRLKERLRPRWERAITEHDKTLMPTYRKRERIPDSGEEAERSTDEFEFVNDVYVYLPVAHHIARTMLENHFGTRGLARLAFTSGERAR